MRLHMPKRAHTALSREFSAVQIRSPTRDDVFFSATTLDKLSERSLFQADMLTVYRSGQT